MTIADPRPVVTLTLIPPIILHTMMYHSMLFLPYLPERISNGNEAIPPVGDVPRGEVEYNDQGRRNEDAAIDQESR